MKIGVQYVFLSIVSTLCWPVRDIIGPQELGKMIEHSPGEIPPCTVIFFRQLTPPRHYGKIETKNLLGGFEIRSPPIQHGGKFSDEVKCVPEGKVFSDGSTEDYGLRNSKEGIGSSQQQRGESKVKGQELLVSPSGATGKKACFNKHLELKNKIMLEQQFLGLDLRLNPGQAFQGTSEILPMDVPEMAEPSISERREASIDKQLFQKITNENRKAMFEPAGQIQHLPSGTQSNIIQEKRTLIPKTSDVLLREKEDPTDLMSVENPILAGVVKRKCSGPHVPHFFSDSGKRPKSIRIRGNALIPVSITNNSELGVKRSPENSRMKNFKPGYVKALEKLEKNLIERQDGGMPFIYTKTSDGRKNLIIIKIDQEGVLHRMDQLRKTKEKYLSSDRLLSTHAAIEELGEQKLKEIGCKIDLEQFYLVLTRRRWPSMLRLIIHSAKQLLLYIEHFNNLLEPPLYHNFTEVQKAQKEAFSSLINYWMHSLKLQDIGQIQDSSRNCIMGFTSPERSNYIKFLIQKKNGCATYGTSTSISNIIFDSWLETNFKEIFMRASDSTKRLKKWILVIMNDKLMSLQPPIKSFLKYHLGPGKKINARKTKYVEFLNIPEFRVRV